MEAPPGPLGPPPDYEAALASGPAAPPTNPIGPRGAGRAVAAFCSNYLDFMID